MRKSRRVVITGLGVVAPNGIGKHAFWDALVAGKSGIDYITSFDSTPYACDVAAEVKDFEPANFMTKKNARELWRFSQFALASAQMAIDDAKLEITDRNRVDMCQWSRTRIRLVRSCSAFELFGSEPTHVVSILYPRTRCSCCDRTRN